MTHSRGKNNEKIAKKVASGTGALKTFINKGTASLIYKALVEPNFECCSVELAALYATAKVTNSSCQSHHCVER